MPRLLVGTSGFGYREWKGKFFPKTLPAERYLAYYAERLDAVEINSSFYRMPKASVISSWLPETPKRFSFSFKAPASITHMKRLKNAQRELELFLDATAAVHSQLGCRVFQLPPNFKKDLPRLKDFLDLLPPNGRFAFEFRNASWFADDVLAALENAGAALCVNDADVEGCPVEATAPFGVLKLRRVDYTEAELRSWARKIGKQKWRAAFAFFKHEPRATGPKHAERLRALFER